MNRRNFFKTVTGFAAGLCAVVLPSKVIGKKRSGTRLVTEEQTQEVFHDIIMDAGLSYKDKVLLAQTAWDKLGCKDCFRGCGQWDICMATLEKRVKLNKV